MLEDDVVLDCSNALYQKALQARKYLEEKKSMENIVTEFVLGTAPCSWLSPHLREREGIVRTRRAEPAFR